MINISDQGLEFLEQAGWTETDLEKLYNGHAQTLAEYRLYPPENCIIRLKHDIMASFPGHVTKMKRSSEWFVDIKNYMELVNTVIHCLTPTQKYILHRHTYRGQDLNKKTLLYWMYGQGAGDIIFSLPILRTIKHLYPSSYIVVAVPNIYHKMLQGLDYIDDIINIPFLAQYYYSADYHLYFDSLIQKCAESNTRNIYDVFADWACIKVPDAFKVPVLVPIPETVTKFKKILKKMDITDFILCQLDASTADRSLSVDDKITVVNNIRLESPYPIVFCDSQNRKKHVDEILKIVNVGHTYNLSQYSADISDLVGLGSLAASVVSVDTSVVHIAAALSKPILAYPMTVPGHLRFSYYQNCNWVDNAMDILKKG